MLMLTDVHASYDGSEVLFGLCLSIAERSVTSLLGRNGMGKTTTVRCIMGLLQPTSGSIDFKGASLRGLRPDEVACAGLGLVPEGRQLFPNLSVLENLTVAAKNGGDPKEWTLERVLVLFPALENRLTHMGSQLSGGEQQMVAIGRALMTNPRLLILDEATEGLSPLIRQHIWKTLVLLKSSGLTILLIDKNIAAVSRVADRHYIIERGRVVWEGDSEELRLAPDVQQRYLGV